MIQISNVCATSVLAVIAVGKAAAVLDVYPVSDVSIVERRKNKHAT